MWLRDLSALECAKLLEASRVGRLACAKDGQPYVVPIYYAYKDNHLYAFSMPGKKLDYMRANPRVSVLVEERISGRQWRSVIVEGRFEELPDRIGHKVTRDHAWSQLSKHSDWWEPGALKPATLPVADHSPHVFFRIFVDQLSGREARE
jgi:nitroimidazol reductase NimA-like FMN-containing flavoprotein (pyridoxamine 5'-phosphate oxidase superfamily)